MTGTDYQRTRISGSSVVSLRQEVSLALGLVGVVAYNWWVLVPFRRGLMTSVNGFFSDLEVSGHPDAGLMSHLDVAAGLLIALSLVVAGRGWEAEHCWSNGAWSGSARLGGGRTVQVAVPKGPAPRADSSNGTFSCPCTITSTSSPESPNPRRSHRVGHEAERRTQGHPGTHRTTYRALVLCSPSVTRCSGRLTSLTGWGPSSSRCSSSPSAFWSSPSCCSPRGRSTSPCCRLVTRSIPKALPSGPPLSARQCDPDTKAECVVGDEAFSAADFPRFERGFHSGRRGDGVG